MDKFIKFGENIFNTNYIVAIGKCTMTSAKIVYGIEIYTTIDVDRIYFNTEEERNDAFDSLSNQLLNK